MLFFDCITIISSVIIQNDYSAPAIDVKDKVQAKKLKAFSEKLKKNNKALEKDISTFRTSGSTTNNNAKDDDEDEDEDEEEESPKPTTKAPAKPAAGKIKKKKKYWQH